MIKQLRNLGLSFLLACYGCDKPASPSVPPSPINAVFIEGRNDYAILTKHPNGLRTVQLYAKSRPGIPGEMPEFPSEVYADSDADGLVDKILFNDANHGSSKPKVITRKTDYNTHQKNFETADAWLKDLNTVLQGQ